MLHPFVRSACAAMALLATAGVPCFAQTSRLPPAQTPPTAPLSASQLDSPANQFNGNYPGDGWYAQPGGAFPEPGPAPTAEPSSSPFYQQFWDGLAETPPRAYGSGREAGFGFDQNAVLAPSYRVTWFPDAPVVGQGTNLNAVRQEFRVVCPVYIDDSQMFGLTTSVRNVIYDTNAVIPNTSQAFPTDLWDIRFGVTYKYTFANGWSTGGEVNFGSASDRPFGGVNELTGGVSTFLRIPVGDHNAWLFSLMYSPTGELNFPLPGVAFYWQPSDWFNATIGVPFKLVYRPTDDVTLEAAWMPLTTITARASWRVWGGVYLYTGYSRGDESYFLYGRQDESDRFFYYDERIAAGVKMIFGPHLIADLSGGYAFNRYFFEGHSYSDDQSSRIDVGNSPFLSMMVEWRF